MFHSKLKERGYSQLYHAQATNLCPGCGRSHWYVGRTSAECAFCATAIPLAENRSVVHADWRAPVAA